jgi:hypothetical protein
MKLRLKKDPEQIELIKQMGSNDEAVARPAKEAFAAIIGPVVEKVLQKAGSANLIYRDFAFNQDDNPSLPVELWYGEDVNYITIWYQTVAGGLPTSVVEGNDEMKFHTYRLDSSIAFDKKYARKANVDVVSKGLERMSQEVLIKQERNAWAVALKALAESSTNGLSHIISATTADIFQVADLNALLTRTRRINTAWNKDTPVGFQSKGVTDLFVSPEIKEQVRGFAYQPMNTRATPDTNESTVLGLPDNVREEIYRAAGANEIYGVNLIELLEFGTTQKYNVLFDNYYSGSFNSSTDEIIVGIDLSREGLIRPVETSEGGSTFTAVNDDQYVSRQEKIGFYGFLKESRVCIDSRVLTGLII